VPIETVSKMLRHQDITTTQTYAEVTNMKMDEDMRLLETRIGNKYQFPNANTESKTRALLEFERNNRNNTEFEKLKQRIKTEEAI
jgi:hypothetical protein